MTSQIQASNPAEIIYPDSDGQPMADNTKQFRWIVTIKQNLDWLFADDDNVFVAGDLLWYPIEGDNKTRIAPDAMVVFGRPKGDRGSYQQWKEDHIAPQVVFEILSPGNTLTEMAKKQQAYDRYGVEEYYIYDPDNHDLSGYLRLKNQPNHHLEVIDAINGWVSPRLGIKFDMSQTELQIFYPDGKRFASYVEIAQQLEREKQRADRAIADLAQERQKAEALAQKLREMGIDPEQV